LRIKEKGLKFAFPFFYDRYMIPVKILVAKLKFKVPEIFLKKYLVVLKNGFSFAPAFGVRKIEEGREREKECNSSLTILKIDSVTKRVKLFVIGL